MSTVFFYFCCPKCYFLLFHRSNNVFTLSSSVSILLYILANTITNETKATADGIAEQKKIVESKLRISEDRATRNQVMTDLLAPLSKDKKELMTELLESVKTGKLEDSFNKYLPSVINEEVSVRSKKAIIKESVTSEHTGNRSLDGQTGSTNEEKLDSAVVEIDELRKLAGLK